MGVQPRWPAARDLLALVCGWFTESFETCALNYSLGRLDELG